MRGSKNKTRKKRPYTANNTNSEYKGVNDAESYCGSGGLHKSDASTSTAKNMNDKGTFSTERDRGQSDAFTSTTLQGENQSTGMQQYNQLMQNALYNNWMLYNKEYQGLCTNNIQMQNNTAFARCNPQYNPNFMRNEIVCPYRNCIDHCRQNCMSPCADLYNMYKSNRIH
ncbi:hypothetical protein WA026_013668 [Henosepilachna vigintioctopunctata]|uniref:Uncharacterized protein n=1 Tax=Henosepilachna vigintioctopunctata TaxID=420089 RepID=A0AAW1URN9_9CUCU